MAPKPPLAVKIEVLLNDKDKKFYPGDTVMGKIFITSNQNYSLKNLRLAWTGRIQVQPLKDNKEVQKYFNECWKLGPKITKAPSKTPYGSSQISFYKGELISVTDQDPEPKVELSKNKPFAFAFEVHVPNDRPLPSSTIENTNYKIIYLLEAFIAQPETNEEEKPAFFGQRTVPVLEPIYTRTEEMMRPQRAEQVFTVVPSNDAVDYKSAVRVTLPCRGCQTGVAIPISISIWNNVEFSRKQGISISLFRVNQIVANGRAYTSAGEKVHRIVADLDITPDAKENNQLVQTVRVALPIPKGTTPTITLEKSGLLSIAYYIRVQVYAQEGQYITPDGAMSKFMLVDIPFVVGTLATPLESPKSTSTTPISSPKSSFNGVIFTEVYTENSSRVTSPTNTNFTDSRYSFSSSSSPPPYPATLTSSFGIVPTSSTSATSNGRTTNQGSTPITSPVLTNYKNNENDSVTSGGSTNSDGGTTTTSAATTLIDNKKGGRMMGGMFRKSSSGSNVSVENKKTKKKNVFSSFKLYSRSNSNASTKVVTEDEEEKANSMPDKNYAEERKEDQQKEENNVQIEDQATLPVSNEGGGVFDIFSRDDDSFDESKDQQEKSPAGEVEKVFKMFPDDDSDDEEPEEPETQPQSGGGGGGVFQLFPDDDSDDDDDNAEDRTVSSAAPPLHSDNSENLDSTAANIEAPLTYEEDSMTNQRLLSSHVHQMFNDSTDDENEESDVQGLSISEPIEASNTEEQKPNAKEEEVFHKPDTNDETQPSMHEEHDGSDMSSDEDEYDILGALARKERLQRKIA